MRGMRFNFVKRLVDFTPKDELLEIAQRIAPLGWHVVVYFEAADLPELWDFFTALPTTVVVDHMGRPDVTKPVDGPRVRAVPEAAARAPERLVEGELPGAAVRLRAAGARRRAHAYRDVVPFARRIVETFPDRVLWGTDWPHPNLKDHMPDDGLLVDFIPHIATTPELQQQAAGRQPDAPLLARRDPLRTTRWHSTSRTRTSPARRSSTPSSRARATTSTSSACR